MSMHVQLPSERPPRLPCTSPSSTRFRPIRRTEKCIRGDDDDDDDGDDDDDDDDDDDEVVDAGASDDDRDDDE